MDPEAQRLISITDQRRLLEHLELGDVERWLAQQHKSGRYRIALDHWHPQAAPDWLWSVGLPLLSLAEKWSGKRRLIGFSALPGCGKTTLGQWIEAAAKALDLSVQVVSLDDFYFEAKRLDEAMRGTPGVCPVRFPAAMIWGFCRSVSRHGDRVRTSCCPASTKPNDMGVEIGAVGVVALPTC